MRKNKRNNINKLNRINKIKWFIRNFILLAFPAFAHPPFPSFQSLPFLLGLSLGMPMPTVHR
jgi:hypothetical protein